MAASEPTRVLDPSDYVAHHLQNFSTSHPTSAVDFHVWNRYSLFWLVLVAVAVAYFAARKDRRPVFQVFPPMRFGQRLSIWWSCIWRQTLATLPVFVIGMAAFLYVVVVKLPVMMSGSAAARVLTIMNATFDVVVVICGAVSLPLTGYMVRQGFVAHALAVPDPFTFRQATLLGLTTVVWTAFGIILTGFVTSPFQYPVVRIFNLLMQVIWGVYIVLPRQVYGIA